MKSLSPSGRFQLLSSYADGEVDAATRQKVEELLASSAEARQELEQIRAMRKVLSAQPPLPADHTFWTKLSVRVRERQEEEGNLLPFPRRFAPAAAAFAVVVLLAAGLALYERRGAVEEFIAGKAEQVQRMYQDGVLKGSLLPLFSTISSDQVLQFAMYGALPLDATAETALRIDESTPQGYTIELGKKSDPFQRPVTIEKLVEEVRPTHEERRAIDSLLELARKRLSGAVFVAENNALAVDPELPGFNKVVLAQIAECLEPVRRTRFDMFLKKHEAAFGIQTRTSQKRAVQSLPRGTKPERFLVVTPDTFALTALPFDPEAAEQQRAAAPHTVLEVQARVQSLIRHFQQKDALRIGPVNFPNASVRVWGDREFLEIEFHPPRIPSEPDTPAIVVRTRPSPRRHPQREMLEIRVGREKESEFDSLENYFPEGERTRIEMWRKVESKPRPAGTLPPGQRGQIPARGSGVAPPKDSLDD